MMMMMMMMTMKFLPNPSGERDHSLKFLSDRKLVACGGGTIPEIHRDGRDHSQKFLLNPSDERNHLWQFLLDRKLVAPGGGKTPDRPCTRRNGGHLALGSGPAAQVWLSYRL